MSLYHSHLATSNWSARRVGTESVRTRHCPLFPSERLKRETDRPMKLVSICIPVYDEEPGIPALGRELAVMMERNSSYAFEVILVENGSQDRSYDALLELNRRDPRFKIVRLSRNFTADGGVAAGLKHCAGDCAVLMDADLQDPPEIIDAFLAKWEEGYEVVYGVIQHREHVSALRRFFNGIFYRIISAVTKGNIPANVTAFRLMDCVVYSELNQMEEANRFTRGLSSWVGFEQIGVPFRRAARREGDSKVSFFDVLKEGLDALFSFSTLPLKMISVFGALLSGFCVLFIIYQFVLTAFFQSPFPGYRTIVVLNLMMFGFIFVALGVIGEYVSRIFDNVKGRPNFIVRELVGIDRQPPARARTD
jgi:polyisoprenyl-phosphate glycosyltransferase